MFDRIAPRYDLLNRVLSAGIDVRWRRACVDALGPEPALALDVCTGTADLLLEFLRRDARRRGAGLDLSRPMLERGAAKLARAGWSGRARLLQGDAERLPFGSGGFDAALVAFGIRNVSDVPAALGEMHRVLRPGGRLAILEFAEPPGLLGDLYRRYFQHVLPRVGALVSGDASAYRYLPASVGRFASPQELQQMMRGTGFGGVGGRPLTGGIAWLHLAERAA